MQYAARSWRSALPVTGNAGKKPFPLWSHVIPAFNRKGVLTMKMKKIGLFIATLAACLIGGVALTGCTPGQKSAASLPPEKKIQIVCTNFPGYDFARHIVKDHGEVTMLVKPGTDVHSFSPSPKDLKAVADSDLLIYTGGDSDEWVGKILDATGKKPGNVFRMMDAVKLSEEEHPEGMQPKEEAEKEEGPEMDEHVWTAPANAIEIVKKLNASISKLDGAHAEEYQKNADAYMKELSDLDQSFRDVIDHADRKEIIVGDRFPFLYFIKEYGLTYYAAFPGCAKDTEADPKTIAFLINKVKADQIPVIFHIELSNQQMSRSIAEATGAKERQLNSIHNVTQKDFDAGVTYVDLMRQNVKTLKEALN
jgi:zinc transport system substrate-binding protein